MIKWRWERRGTFSVKTLYESLSSGSYGRPLRRIWKGKIPPKIKIFMWLLENGVILTKDNMIRRNWSGNPTCFFCENDESIDHLFFACPVARVVCGCVAVCLESSYIPGCLEHY